MTIAGSDSGGGAGIQADLAAFFNQGVYGVTVITALTAQNTVQVAGVHPAPAEFVALQIRTVMEDIPVQAAKTGMLYNSKIVRAVAQEIRAAKFSALVVDPVMIAKSGDSLLQDDAVDSLAADLLPLAFFATPNKPEAERLAGLTIKTKDDMKKAAEKIVALGAKNVVVKGGHMDTADEVTDVALVDGVFEEFTRPRFNTKNTHGTGCTFSAALAAGLARGLDPDSAVKNAWTYIGKAIAMSWPLGKGHGPVERFFI